MNSYNKQALDIIAKEQGFIRDNLEKVMRLVEILNYFHDSPLLSKSLVLKGGTAINLTVFQLPRLSVDIDLDFTVDCNRESMLSIRQEVNNEILRYMESDGYHLAPGSKTPLSLSLPFPRFAKKPPRRFSGKSLPVLSTSLSSTTSSLRIRY